MNSAEVPLSMVLLRYGLYVIGMAAFTGAFAWIEISSPGALDLHVLDSPDDLYGTSEHSPVELVQPALLAICALLFGWVARDCPSQRPIAFVMGGLSLACAVRELHYFFDQNVADNFWQAVVGVVLALIIAYGYRQRRRFRIAWLRLWPSPGLTLLFVGATILFVIVQILGHEPLWMAILGSDYVRIAKLAVEEFIELVGYYFVLIGTLEYVYQARAIATREPEPAASRRRKGRRQKASSKY